MANRVIRSSILTSDPVNSLSWTSEIFYRRLMSVVDDFGRFDGRISILRGSLYPLKLNTVSEADIVKWMNECSEAGLVSLYQIDNKPYLEILKFQQTLRIKKSKFPAIQMQANASKCSTGDGLKGNQSESRVETESELKVNSKPAFEKVYVEVMGSERWIADTAMHWKKTIPEIVDLLDNFLKGTIKLKEDWYKGVSEIKKHFISVIKIEFSKEKNSAKKENGTSTSKSKQIIESANYIAEKRGWIRPNPNGEGDL